MIFGGCMKKYGKEDNKQNIYRNQLASFSEILLYSLMNWANDNYWIWYDTN